MGCVDKREAVEYSTIASTEANLAEQHRGEATKSTIQQQSCSAVPAETMTVSIAFPVRVLKEF